MDRLLYALAVNLWLITAFLLMRIVDWGAIQLSRWLPCLSPPKVVPSIQVGLLCVWLAAGMAVWKWWRRFRGAMFWLVGGDLHAAGREDRTGVFATLAGFALAEGAALTAVAKGEGRDGLVILIYAIAVIFSYAWTRCLLRSRESLPEGERFDATTVEQGRYTLAWIVFISSIMITLGSYSLLPNQKWRALYLRDGPITCTAQLAQTYATSPDSPTQEARKWIKWASSKPDKGALYWIEMAAGFDSDYRTFDAEIQHLDRFTLIEVAAFLRHQESPSSMPTYRQLEVHRLIDDESAVRKPLSITIADPNSADRVVLMCNSVDQQSDEIEQKTIDSSGSFWLTPVFRTVRQESSKSEMEKAQ